ILGVFNVSEQALAELIPLAHFPGTRESDTYIIRAHPSGDISPPMRLGAHFATVDLALDVKGWAVLTAYPLLSSPASSTPPPTPRLQSSSSSPPPPPRLQPPPPRNPIHPANNHPPAFAVLGLLRKTTGAAAVLGTPTLRPSASGRGHGGTVNISVTLKALGVLGVYISSLAGMGDGWQDRVLVLLRERAVPVSMVGVCGMVLEIDVEGAWKEMGLVAGWGSEVEVVVVVKG
ncbi:MAG: hypothetical protein Q9196_001077, partial [Gyalolechia fulgens]